MGDVDRDDSLVDDAEGVGSGESEITDVGVDDVVPTSDEVKEPFAEAEEVFVGKLDAESEGVALIEYEADAHALVDTVTVVLLESGADAEGLISAESDVVTLAVELDEISAEREGDTFDVALDDTVDDERKDEDGEELALGDDDTDFETMLDSEVDDEDVGEGGALAEGLGDNEDDIVLEPLGEPDGDFVAFAVEVEDSRLEAEAECVVDADSLLVTFPLLEAPRESVARSET